jgi:arsenite methyltransferase
MSDQNANGHGGCGCGPGCCGGGGAKGAAGLAGDRADAVREHVREGYGAIAEKGAWLGDASREESAGGCCGGDGSGSGGGCCGGSTASPEELAAKLGYTVEELEALPEGANMGLSCGNPTALASLKEGEVVVDLGSGGGFDCFVAGPKVGPGGRVIGVDMTPQMITKARRNLAEYTQATGLANVEFRLGEIEHLPLPDASVDIVISNCVLNLSPDKPQVWRDIGRVLKPGGRVAVSDLALLKPLPAGVMEMVEALVGCISGAVLISETHQQMVDAGLTEITLTSKPQYIDAMTNWEDPLFRKIVEALPKGSAPSEYITSLDITARKV